MPGNPHFPAGRWTPTTPDRPHAVAATIRGVIEADKRQGFRGPLLNLKKKDWEDFSKKEQAFLEGDGKNDEVIAALVRDNATSEDDPDHLGSGPRLSLSSTSRLSAWYPEKRNHVAHSIRPRSEGDDGSRSLFFSQAVARYPASRSSSVCGKKSGQRHWLRRLY